MNMSTLMQELYKKIRLMDRERFNKLLEELHNMYNRTHKDKDTELEFGNISVEAIEELSHCPACIHYIQGDVPNVLCEKCNNRDELYGRIENDK